jgi:hypothetical protein
MIHKRRFWNDEQKMKCGVSIEFSTIRSPNPVLTPLKSASKIRIYLLFILPKSSFGMGKNGDCRKKRGLVADGWIRLSLSDVCLKRRHAIIWRLV